MKAKHHLLLAMTIFGSLGIFIKQIPLPSSQIAILRGVLGVVVIYSVVRLKGNRLDWQAIRLNKWYLFLSGSCIGLNWLLFFEAYRYTSVAIATICYYFAPIFMVVFSAIFFKETITKKQLLSIFVALLGMILIVGLFNETLQSQDSIGILYSLGAAILYASVILLNKKIKQMTDQDKTIVQLFIASVILLPYTLASESISFEQFTPLAWLSLALVGVLHTGLAYTLYFGAIKRVDTQTTALFSYVDPLVAIVCSILILGEPLSLGNFVGALLILGANIWNELS